MSFDTRCFDLAEVFLEDHSGEPNYNALVHELAQDIQSTIEGFLLMNPTRAEREEAAQDDKRAANP